MYFSQDQILEMAHHVKATINFDADSLGKRTYNAVAKALKQGYIPTRGGAAATYYGLLVNHFNMPHMCFSRGSKWWDGVVLFNLPDECVKPLEEFWHADRVMFRLEHPEEYEKALGSTYYSGVRDAIKEPQFDKLIQASRSGANAYMRILYTKDEMHFNNIAKEYLNTFTYQQKLKDALDMLARGGAVSYQLKGAQ